MLICVYFEFVLDSYCIIWLVFFYFGLTFYLVGLCLGCCVLVFTIVGCFRLWMFDLCCGTLLLLL